MKQFIMFTILNTFVTRTLADEHAFVVIGDCDTQANCVSSENYPFDYGSNNVCTVTMIKDVVVIPSKEFSIETGWDLLSIGDEGRIQYIDHVEDMPKTLSKGATLHWTSDASHEQAGWKVCFNNPSENDCETQGEPNDLCIPGEDAEGNVCYNDGAQNEMRCFTDMMSGDFICGTPGCQSSPDPVDFDVIGDCDIEGDCVSSHNWPEVHGSNEQCTVTLHDDASLTVGPTFKLEQGWDHLTIRGTSIQSPAQVPADLHAGEVIHWSSDGSENNEGWQICFSRTEQEEEESDCSDYDDSTLGKYGLPAFVDDHFQVTQVFGSYVLTPKDIPQNLHDHVAKVLAQYLDNDADGCPDDQSVANNMAGVKAVELFLVSEDDETAGLPQCVVDWVTDNMAVQTQFQHETKPQCSGKASTANADGCRDATLEEVLHLITDYGYAAAYPKLYGTDFDSPSLLTGAMDVARGGRYKEIPAEYPKGAWYTYNDDTCEYNCMATEYFYWALTSILGAQYVNDAGICWNSQEWKPCTLKAVQSTDTLVFELLYSKRQSVLPNVIPDGTYDLSIMRSDCESTVSLAAQNKRLKAVNKALNKALQALIN